MTEDRVKLEDSWKAALRPEFDQPYMQNLRTFLATEKRAGKQIFPPGTEMFAALAMTAPSKVCRCLRFALVVWLSQNR